MHPVAPFSRAMSSPARPLGALTPEQIAAAIPGAEFKLLETAHAFNVEEADAFNATVLEFLQRH